MRAPKSETKGRLEKGGRDMSYLTFFGNKEGGVNEK